LLLIPSVPLASDLVTVHPYCDLILPLSGVWLDHSAEKVFTEAEHTSAISFTNSNAEAVKSGFKEAFY